MMFLSIYNNHFDAKKGGDRISKAKTISVNSFCIVKVIRPFYDTKHNLELRKIGEEISTSPDRAEKLISLGLAEKPDADAPEAAAEK